MSNENIEVQTPETDPVVIQKPVEGTEGITKGEPQVPEIDYKEKFSASSRESQRLSTENKLLMSENEKEKSTLLAQLADKEALIKQFSEDNPEKYSTVNTVAEIQKLREKVVLQEEKTALDEYIRSNPEAEGQKDSLQRLGRAYPDKNYSTLWDETFKGLVTSKSVEEAEKEAKKSRQPDSGDGSMSEVVGSHSLADFNKMSVAKRREYFKTYGATL